MTALWLVQTAAERIAAAREGIDTPLAARLMGLVGVATMLVLAWALSINRKRIDWRLVGIGLTLQIVFGLFALKTAAGQAFFAGTDAVFSRLLGFTEEGARFIFGNLVKNNVPVGAPVGPPFDMAPVASPTAWAATGAYFAFSVLPTIIFF